MRVLVTGATGFLGSHLVDALVARGDVVTALVRDKARARALWPTQVRLETPELTDRIALEAVMHRAGPQQVYHLAAQSYPLVSWKDPQATFRANLTGTAALLEAVRAWGGVSRVMVTGSSSSYALSTGGAPIAEGGAVGPSSPYGVSKLACDAAAHLYATRYGMNVVRIRPFFLIGTRKTGDACSDFSRRIVQAEKTGDGSMTVGNLDMVRDLLDVRDGIRGLLAVMEKGVTGEVYNICSGRGYSLHEVLGILKGLARVPIREQLDPALLRPVDEPIKIGDPARLMALGWAPQHGLEESLRDILDYWRQREA